MRNKNWFIGLLMAYALVQVLFTTLMTVIENKTDLLPALTFLNLIGWIIVTWRIIWKMERDE